MQHSPTIAAIGKALSLAQGEIKNPPRERENPFYHSKYADLATVRNAAIPIFAKYGLSCITLPETTNERGDLVLETLLMHESGEWIRSLFTIPIGKKDAQGYISATTYARRNILQALAAVSADDDDDAEGSISRKEKSEEKPLVAVKKEAKPSPEDQLRQGTFVGHHTDGTYVWVSIKTDKGSFDFSFDQPPGELKDLPPSEFQQLINRQCHFKAQQSKRNGKSFFLLTDIAFVPLAKSDATEDNL